MRAADLLGRLPQAPSRRQPAAPLLLLFDCVTSANSVPPKRAGACLFINVRGCLPQSLHSPQFSEPDPIYPYLPFLFSSSFGNDHANRVAPRCRTRITSDFIRKLKARKLLRTLTYERVVRKVVHVRYRLDHTVGRLSFAGRVNSE
jgi:hypothetical protein